MNVLIIEDEQLASERLKRIILEIDPTIQVKEEIDTIRDSVAFLQSNSNELDLIFCDIHLADGLSFEIFNQVSFHKPVIFTTAYDEYSIEAFKVNSIDYLLKPIKKEDVSRSLEKYRKIYSDSTFDFSVLKELIKSNKTSNSKRLLVKSGSKLIAKKHEEIALIYIENKVVQVLDTPGGKNYLIDFTLDDIQRNELNANIFFRINRKQIVNIESIDSMKPYYNQRLSLALKISTDMELIVSREKVNDFKKWFLR